jgi:hypothetical protein
VKRSIVLSGLLLLISMSFASVQTTSFAEAKKLAAEHNRPVLMDFMTDW